MHLCLILSAAGIPTRSSTKSYLDSQKTATKPAPKQLYAIIDHPEPYVQPLILDALKDVPYNPITSTRQLPCPESSPPLLQITAYESLDFEHAVRHPGNSLVCAYMIRKALIRKHYLSNTISTWLVKKRGQRSATLLADHFKAAVHFELDYAENLDEALVDAWDLNESMERNEKLTEVGEKGRRGKEWWILKPGMSDGGNGIRLFSSIEQLREIFEEWEEDEEESEEDEEDEEDEESEEQGGDETIADKMESMEDDRNLESRETTGVMISQLRHFIAQPYIDPPLLLPNTGNRKFHLRVYVLAVGALKVYVYREMLALFAAKPYQPPSKLGDGDKIPIDMTSHLTNTCFQPDAASREESICRFWDLEEDACVTNPEWREDIFKQICDVTAVVFEAAAREQMVHFQPLPNGFEIFGVDFLVDSSHKAWLLELNAYPDFKQTGERLQDDVVGGLFREVVRTAIQSFFFHQADGTTDDDDRGQEYGDSDRMPLVGEIDLGRR